MKNITLPVIASALIGFILGGLIMAAIDHNRPKPLFSSAAVTSCMDEIQEAANRANHRPISAGQWLVEINHFNNLVIGYEGCARAVCDPIATDINEHIAEYNSIMANIHAWEQIHHPPYTPEEQLFINTQNGLAESLQEERIELEAQYYDEEDCDNLDDPDFPYVDDTWSPNENGNCTTATARPGGSTDAKMPATTQPAAKASISNQDHIITPRIEGGGGSPSSIEEEQSCEDTTVEVTDSDPTDPNGDRKAY